MCIYVFCLKKKTKNNNNCKFPFFRRRLIRNSEADEIPEQPPPSRRWAALSWPRSRVNSLEVAGSGSWVRFFSTPRAPETKRLQRLRARREARSKASRTQNEEEPFPARLLGFTLGPQQEMKQQRVNGGRQRPAGGVLHSRRRQPTNQQVAGRRRRRRRLIAHCTGATGSLAHTVPHQFTAYPPEKAQQVWHGGSKVRKPGSQTHTHSLPVHADTH